MEKHPVQQIADAVGGTITEAGQLPDGSGFAMMSMPLPKNHWSTRQSEAYEPPPMPLRLGNGRVATMVLEGEGPSRTIRWTRRELAEALTAAGRYAYRAATMQGKEPDLDPDALMQNLVVGMLGYWSHDGLSGDAWANPEVPWDPQPPSTDDARNGSVPSQQQ
jgi:hypothetical protein